MATYFESSSFVYSLIFILPLNASTSIKTLPTENLALAGIINFSFNMFYLI